MFIDHVVFKNFRALRDTVLPLCQLTVLVGPNGSGKSSALEGILACGNQNLLQRSKVVSAPSQANSLAEITLCSGDGQALASASWNLEGKTNLQPSDIGFVQRLQRCQIFSFEPRALPTAASLNPNAIMQENGSQLAAELDQLRDRSPERFEELNAELNRWLPEFDRILFQTPGGGKRSIELRTTSGGVAIPATELSFGTLAALAFLTLAYRVDPPPLLCLEEPDRGIHPRLLPNLQEALYRLAYPASFGEKREPTQIIVTTHSPYFLDLFKDHPEEVVVADKIGDSTVFKRLVDLPNVEDLFSAGPLGEAWFSGMLGGIPAA